MPEMKTIHHVVHGPADMWAIDADSALRRHPEEWSSDPFSAEATKAAKAKLAEEQAAKAKAPPVTPSGAKTDELIAAAVKKAVEETLAKERANQPAPPVTPAPDPKAGPDANEARKANDAPDAKAVGANKPLPGGQG